MLNEKHIINRPLKFLEGKECFCCTVAGMTQHFCFLSGEADKQLLQRISVAHDAYTKNYF
jgi:hypothetical protein